MTAVINSLRERMENQYGEEESWSTDEKLLTIKFEIASEIILNDINGLGRATKMNMVMNNDGAETSYNSIRFTTARWDEETRKKLAKALESRQVKFAITKV